MIEPKELDNHAPIIKLKEAFEYLFTIERGNYVVSIDDFNKVFDTIFENIPKNTQL